MNSIRIATSLDSHDIQKVHSQAFSGDEGQLVAALAINLLTEETTPETFALVAEVDRTVVGHIAFSPLTVDTGEHWRGYILAPVGVKPEYQAHRIGSGLIEVGMKMVSEKGVNLLFVYGDPKYYGKFGFKSETAAKYLPPYELRYPSGWQAVTICEESSRKKTVRISCVTSLRDPVLW